MKRTATINSKTADSLISQTWKNLQAKVESGGTPLSSEKTFTFLFALELGRILKFTNKYQFDFEWNAYSDLDSDDTFLDLLVYTNPDFKLAIEFKLPKKSNGHGSNSTQTRAKICRDISRLNYLVVKRHNSIRIGYFLCATNESSYIAKGNKSSNLQYETYNKTIYKPEHVIPSGKPPNGITRRLHFPNHEVCFEWEGVAYPSKQRATIKGQFAWLKPIKVMQGTD